MKDGITISYGGLSITMTPEELHEVMQYSLLDLKSLFAAALKRFPGRAVKA